MSMMTGNSIIAFHVFVITFYIVILQKLSFTEETKLFSAWCPLIGHTYLDKLAAESYRFV